MGADEETLAACAIYLAEKKSPRNLKDTRAFAAGEGADDSAAAIAVGAAKLGAIKYNGVKERSENFIKMFLATARDVRSVIIKLTDRYCEMQALGSRPAGEQKQIALETLEIYAPIANRLGIGELKGLLEDESFRYLLPAEFKRLEKEVAARYEARRNYAEKIKPLILEALKKEKIFPFEINVRAKHFYSLYKKLQRRNTDLDKIHDLVAARIIVKSINDCYLALGALHNNFKPLAGFVNDYIAMPKPNGYQSLHTTIYGPEEKIIEIQIRTRQMHNRAENGIAAHWAYKEKSNRQEIGDSEAALIGQLREWQKSIGNKNEDSFKIDVFNDRVFVLTPKGDVVDLPEGATPVDFAYQIHSKIGDECAGVRINGKIAALGDKLKSGETIEILVQKGKKPSADWLNFVKTGEAKERIKSVLKRKKLRI